MKKMNATKKLAALVAACIMVAAVGMPVVCGESATAGATVSGKSPVINSITFSGDEATGTSVSLTPGPSATTTTPVTITAVIYCKNGPKAIEEVTADISPVIVGYSESITMTEESTDPSAHTADYTTTINIPSNTAPDDYTVTVTATHRQAGVSPGTGSEDLTVLATVAIADLGAVEFGTLDPGETSAAQTVQVTNWGNVDITIGVEPGALSHDDDTIPADCITTTWDSGTPIAVGNGASVPVTLTVPLGTPDGAYSGEITFTPAEAEA
jgi:hypothetical protein